VVASTYVIPTYSEESASTDDSAKSFGLPLDDRNARVERASLLAFTRMSAQLPASYNPPNAADRHRRSALQPSALQGAGGGIDRADQSLRGRRAAARRRHVRQRRRWVGAMSLAISIQRHKTVRRRQPRALDGRPGQL